jgi:hypothetical protein
MSTTWSSIIEARALAFQGAAARSPRREGRWITAGADAHSPSGHSGKLPR